VVDALMGDNISGSSVQKFKGSQDERMMLRRRHTRAIDMVHVE